MRTLQQFLEDFVYTTDQSKTDQHVKNFVKDYIDRPEIELFKNGIKIHGNLKKFQNNITFNNINDGIAITTTITKAIQQIAADVIGKMVNDMYVDLTVKDTKSETFSDDSNIRKTITIVYTFTSESYIGSVTVTIDATSDADNDEKIKSYGCTIQAKWGSKR